MQPQAINWFPGHMAKANKQILDSINNVDLVLEVVDSRAIKTTSNPIFAKLNKPVLKVGLKSDLADIKNINSTNLVVGSIKNKSFRTTLLNAIRNTLAPLAARKKAKGFAHPTFYLMVVGLPNVGKSSLINFLANKNLAATGNKPAVTRNQSILKIADDLYLQDNPGIFVKNIDNVNDGYILALVNTIKKEVLPLKEVLSYAYDYLIDHYHDQFNKYYDLNNNMKFDEFIKWYANKRHFIINNNELDINRAYDAFFDDVVNGKICKINYEK